LGFPGTIYGNPFPVFAAAALQPYPFLKQPAPDVTFVCIILPIPAICAGLVFHTNASPSSIARHKRFGTKTFRKKVSPQFLNRYVMFGHIVFFV
jgi:hypothetical protein